MSEISIVAPLVGGRGRGMGSGEQGGGSGQLSMQCTLLYKYNDNWHDTNTKESILFTFNEMLNYFDIIFLIEDCILYYTSDTTRFYR